MKWEDTLTKKKTLKLLFKQNRSPSESICLLINKRILSVRCICVHNAHADRNRNVIVLSHRNFNAIEHFAEVAPLFYLPFPSPRRCALIRTRHNECYRIFLLIYDHWLGLELQFAFSTRQYLRLHFQFDRIIKITQMELKSKIQRQPNEFVHFLIKNESSRAVPETKTIDFARRTSTSSDLPVNLSWLARQLSPFANARVRTSQFISEWLQHVKWEYSLRAKYKISSRFSENGTTTKSHTKMTTWYCDRGVIYRCAKQA